MNPGLEEGLIGVGVAGLGVLAAWFNNKRRLLAEKTTDTVLDAASIYEELVDLQRSVYASRVLILSTTNGGGIPTSSGPLYVSVLYEVLGENEQHFIREEWQKVLMDHSYVELLKKVVMNEFVLDTPDNLKKGMLKDLYETEGVHTYLISELMRAKDRFIFLSIRWRAGEEILPHYEVATKVRGHRERLRRLLK